MQSQLARIGIDLSIRIVDHAAMHDLIRQDQNPIVIYIAWRPNPDVYLTRFFHSDSIVVTGEKPDTNFSHFDRIDKLIDAARLEVNAQKQIELWKHAQIKILDEMAAYPLLIHNIVFARGSNVDYGHELVSSMALYPQITEKTKIENQTGED
jgi:peptide/nickel transport system substrate-binding protein